jgi:serine/threonine-protein kinase
VRALREGGNTLGFGATPLPAEATRGRSLVGERFGSFQVVRELGRGGMGTVWLAQHNLIQKRVAVKVLHQHLAEDPLLVSRFLSEARTLTLVQHENVVSLYDLGTRDGRPYLIMEYLQGQSLAAFAKGPLEPALAVDLLCQVCDALGAAHAHGIVHRDLKPANVLLVPLPGGRQRVKLVDFGVAKLLSHPSANTPTQAGVLLGTPEFMAPEQCGAGTVDARTDLYAAGVLAYLLLTGAVPFTGRHPAEVLLAHLQKPPCPPHEVMPSVPQALSRVVLKALAKRSEERYASAAELRAALEAALTPVAEPRTAIIARVRTPGGGATLELKAELVGRSGLFLHAEAAPPPLMCEVGLLLRLPGGELACTGQVVQHVPVAQAREWNTRPGFGVQLRDNTPGFHEALARLMSGERLAPQVPPLSQAREDARAESLLLRFRRRLMGDHYVMLGLERDATFDAVRAAAREVRSTLEPLLSLHLSPGQRAQVERVLERVHQALGVLGQPERRAEYDAGLRNLEGLERCLAAGLTVTALEECRRRFLAINRIPEGHAAVHLTSGDAFLAANRSLEALAAYEAALRVDPLSLEALKRWRSLRARLRANPPREPTPR